MLFERRAELALGVDETRVSRLSRNACSGPQRVAAAGRAFTRKTDNASPETGDILKGWERSVNNRRSDFFHDAGDAHVRFCSRNFSVIQRPRAHRHGLPGPAG